MNPLHKLCKQFGIGYGDLARISGCDAGSIYQAARPDPTSPVVKAYVAALDALGVRMRIKEGPALAIWFDRPWFDWLYHNNDFRDRWNLGRLPATRKIMRRTLKRMATNNGYGFRKLCKLMEQSHVCTPEGLRHWRHGNLAKMMNARWQRFKTDYEPLRPDEECLRDWRQFLKDQILLKLCPEDPAAAMRYRLTWSEDEGRMYLRAQDRIPEKPRQWIIDAVHRIDWIEAERWGLVTTV
jgi:hypothetical protein